MSKLGLRFLDFEVYPKWWCLVVSDEEDDYPGSLYDNQFREEHETKIKSKMRIYRSDMSNSPSEIVRMIRKEFDNAIVAGYNIRRYDLIIAKCIITGMSPEHVYMASEIVIDDGKTGLADSTPEYQRIAQFCKFGYAGVRSYQDMLDDTVKTLKDKECSLGIDIRETDVPFDKVDLTEEEKQDIIKYCKHDVYALHVYYQCLQKWYTSTKIDLCDIFNIPREIGFKNTNAKLAGIVLGAKRRHGTTMTDPTIYIKDKKFTDYFEKWLPKDIYEHLLTRTDTKEFVLFGDDIVIGDGGLHSVYKLPKIKGKSTALYVEATDEYGLYNVDVSSCYSSVMIFCDSMSRAVDEPERYKEIYQKRIRIKAKPKSERTPDEKRFVTAVKLVLNTTYGAMGNKYLPIYDDYMRSRVCRISQMILLSVTNHLYTEIPGLEVIQTNTDGVLVYAPRKEKEHIQAIVDEFSELSNFIFEFEEDQKIWQFNVNNYIAVNPSGDIKDKGAQCITSVYQPGYFHCRPYSNFGVTRAMTDFYINGTNPVLHILNNTDVEDFCLSCTKGPGYKRLIQHNEDGDVELGKVSRVIAVTDENLGSIVKQKTYGKDTANHKAGEIKEDSVSLCPPHPLVVNDALYNYWIKDRKLYHKDGNVWNIDYAYYARELDKALDTIWYKMKNDTVNVTTEFNL